MLEHRYFFYNIEKWNKEMFEHRDVSTWRCWNIDLLEHRSVGTKRCLNTETCQHGDAGI